MLVVVIVVMRQYLQARYNESCYRNGSERRRWVKGSQNNGKLHRLLIRHEVLSWLEHGHRAQRWQYFGEKRIEKYPVWWVMVAHNRSRIDISMKIETLTYLSVVATKTWGCTILIGVAGTPDTSPMFTD